MSPADPYPTPCPQLLGTRRCNGGPLARVTAKGPAQPEPSPSPAFHHHRHWHWQRHWQLAKPNVLCSAAAAACERLKSQKGLLSVTSVTLPCPHCLILALTFSFSTTPPRPSPPFELVSRSPPLSSDSPGSQGCTLCKALGSTTRTISSLAASLLLCKARIVQPSTAQDGTTVSNKVQPPGTTVSSLWGKAWIQRPILPLVCGFVWTTPQSQISLFLRLVVACTANSACRAQPVPGIASRGWPILLAALAGPGRSHLSDSQWAATRATVHCPALRLHKVD